MTTELKKWIASVTTDSTNAIASKIELGQSSLSRQVNGEVATPPDTVVKIARAYGISPLPGLVQIGFITDDEAASSAEFAVSAALRKASNKQILTEVERRMDEESASAQRQRQTAMTQSQRS